MKIYTIKQKARDTLISIEEEYYTTGVRVCFAYTNLCEALWKRIKKTSKSSYAPMLSAWVCVVSLISIRKLLHFKRLRSLVTCSEELS